ncbi:MAG: carboxylating nicotinate-nucleotide diphosphorylase [Gammaproteobacteria bacterium]|nr:carboxylating nicotinate-nucleotide diphosphorylase [Gammaproteobacteria bacterium]
MSTFKIYPQLLETIKLQVKQALQEDIGTGDISAALIDDAEQACASILSREPAVICGTAWVTEVFQQLDTQIKISWHIEDGDFVQANTTLCEITGPARDLLSGERTALNFLQTLSATATQTRRYVDAIKGTRTRLLDTRKTIPGLRLAQKYAVLCGGGYNHRIGLYDMFLIKENHIIAAGSIAKAVAQARKNLSGIPIEVEVENLAELQQALTANIDRILLDNMDTAMLKQAVALGAGKIPLEASGGVDLNTIRSIAETGIDYISVGGITKHIQAIDLSMRFKKS